MPLSATDFLAQAQRWLNDEQFALVLEQIEAALAHNPDDHELLTLKSESLLGLGRFAEALPLGTKSVTTAPSETVSWLVLCRALRGSAGAGLPVRAHADRSVSSMRESGVRHG